MEVILKFVIDDFHYLFLEVDLSYWFSVIFLGDIFIHCLATYRTPMEDPPSISEGCGGRVTDYRINVSQLFFHGITVSVYDVSEPLGEVKILCSHKCLTV